MKVNISSDRLNYDEFNNFFVSTADNLIDLQDLGILNYFSKEPQMLLLHNFLIRI